jgi:hypothetical protein
MNGLIIFVSTVLIAAVAIILGRRRHNRTQ